MCGIKGQRFVVLFGCKLNHFGQRFTYKMAAENSGHRYDTKLRHCHPMYIIIIRSLRIKAAQNTLQNIKRSSSNKREEIKTNRATIPDRFDRLPEW